MAHHLLIKRPKFNLNELPSLDGKVAIVTGAYAPMSVGYHVAHQLALKGARVYVGARSLDKAEDGIESLMQESPAPSNGLLRPLVMDLANFKEVQKVAQDFLAKEDRLDILVNNAGLLARPLDKDPHGISVSFSTNYVGPFLFTKELLPLLAETSKKNPDVRIINVSSTAHADIPETVKFSSLEDFNRELGGTDDPQSNYFRYGLSKLANILHTKELQRQLDERGVPILAITTHPGGVATTGAAKFLGSTDFPKDVLSPFEGALTPLFAAVHPEPRAMKEQYAGSYLMPFGAITDASPQGKDSALAKQLWETTEQVLKTALA